MKILVTGRSGQLATSLVERAAGLKGIELVATGRPGLDLTDRASVIACMAHEKPDIVISAAAYTAVDGAEEEPDLAYAINATGAASVAEAAERAGAAIIHISTDYVFAGTDPHPYDEESPTGPGTIYGLTKLEGERAVVRLNPRHAIVRTSWLYSPFGCNFLRTMLALAGRQNAIRVVVDQRGNPTSALDLADALLAIAPALRDGSFGIYHLTGSGEASWADFARHILRASRTIGGPFANIVDIDTVDYPAKARRPANSRLCSDKAESTFGVRLPDWRTSTDRTLARLLEGGGHG